MPKVPHCRIIHSCSKQPSTIHASDPWFMTMCALQIFFFFLSLLSQVGPAASDKLTEIDRLSSIPSDMTSNHPVMDSTHCGCMLWRWLYYYYYSLLLFSWSSSRSSDIVTRPQSQWFNTALTYLVQASLTIWIQLPSSNNLRQDRRSACL